MISGTKTHPWPKSAGQGIFSEWLGFLESIMPGTLIISCWRQSSRQLFLQCRVLSTFASLAPGVRGLANKMGAGGQLRKCLFKWLASSTQGLSRRSRARQRSVALMIRSSLLPLQSPSSFPTLPSILAIKHAGVLWEKPNKTLCDHVIKGCTITHRHKGDELMLYGKPPD